MVMLSRKALVALVLAASLSAPCAVGRAQEANYDEAKVPAYTLPDPLRLQNGERVRDAATWFHERRPEVVKLFETQMYGKAPGRPFGSRIASRLRDAAT